MSRGFPEYGARISVDKTLLSFEYETGKQLAPVCGANEQGDVGESILQANDCPLIISRFPLLWFSDTNRNTRHYAGLYKAPKLL